MKIHQWAALLAASLCLPLAQAREITDMAGRRIRLPERIEKIYAAQPYTNVMAYMLAPDLMIGQLFAITGPDKRFLRPEVRNKPVLGAEPGSGQEASFETILAAKPDFVLLKGNDQTDIARTVERYEKFGIPVVFADIDSIDNYPAGIEFLGRITGREKQAAKLAAHARSVLAEVDKAVASIPPEKRVRVYYAESADGLTTECDQSFHTDAIKRAGGRIVHECVLKTHKGMEKVSLEQVMLYNPEFIVSNDPEFEKTVYTDPRWKGIKAVAEHKVLTVPHTPFNWIDRPPSFTRLIGLQWLVYHFYPKAPGRDMQREMREFHALFLGIRPSEADIEHWLARSRR